MAQAEFAAHRRVVGELEEFTLVVGELGDVVGVHELDEVAQADDSSGV
jgi:hypothetical protein